MDGFPTITQEDVDGLNRRALGRSADFCRRASTVLLWTAPLLLAGWLWQVVRYQLLIDDNFDVDIGGSGGRISLAQRVDAAASSIGALAFIVLAVAGALVLRLFADAMLLRAGEDLTGWKVGEPVPSDDGDEDWPPSGSD